jgi:hypothetical protein
MYILQDLIKAENTNTEMEDELLKFLKAGFCSPALNRFFSKGKLIQFYLISKF